MIAVHLSPHDQARLEKLAAERGQTVDQTATSLLVGLLDSYDWPEDREEDWAKSSVSMASRFLPPDDWVDAPRPADGPG